MWITYAMWSECRYPLNQKEKMRLLFTSWLDHVSNGMVCVNLNQTGRHASQFGSVSSDMWQILKNYGKQAYFLVLGCNILMTKTQKLLMNLFQVIIVFQNIINRTVWFLVQIVLNHHMFYSFKNKVLITWRLRLLQICQFSSSLRSLGQHKGLNRNLAEHT